MPRFHETTAVRHPDGRSIDIDEDLVPLITALWARGVRTGMCCQESQPGLVWVAFDSTDDVAAFLAAVGLGPDDLDGLDVANLDYDGLENRALNPDIAYPGGHRVGPWEWQWTFLPHVGRVAVDFPRRDIPDLIDRIARST